MCIRDRRITVRCRLRRRLGADVERGAGTVLDDDRLAPTDRELLADQTWHSVGRGAGRDRHDDPDRPAWISLLRAGDARAERKEGGDRPDRCAPRSVRGGGQVHARGHGGSSPASSPRTVAWATRIRRLGVAQDAVDCHEADVLSDASIRARAWPVEG